MRGTLIVKSSLLIMSPFGLITGTMSPAHYTLNHNEGNNELTMKLIVGLIVGRALIVLRFKQCDGY